MRFCSWRPVRIQSLIDMWTTHIWPSSRNAYSWTCTRSVRPLRRLTRLPDRASKRTPLTCPPRARIPHPTKEIWRSFLKIFDSDRIGSQQGASLQLSMCEHAQIGVRNGGRVQIQETRQGLIGVPFGILANYEWIWFRSNRNTNLPMICWHRTPSSWSRNRVPLSCGQDTRISCLNVYLFIYFLSKAAFLSKHALTFREFE